MIHLRDNCHGTTKFKETELCSICTLHDHHDFVKAKNMGLPARNELYQKVLDGLNDGRSWRVQKKPNSECGHPGVRNTAGKCVFCLTEQRMTGEWKKPKPAIVNTAGEVDALRENIAMIERNIIVLNEQLQMMKNALLLSESGIHVGVIKMKSPRQQAIADGKRWYIPYEPCKHCNIIAERYVANGRCRNCGGK